MRLMGIVMILSGVLALGGCDQFKGPKGDGGVQKVSPVLLVPKETGDRKARKVQRVMLARKVLPVLLGRREIGDRKVHRAQG